MTQPAQVAIRPEIGAVCTRIMSGEVFSGLLLDEVGQRAAALQAVLDKVVDDGTRVAWVGNPLRSPLTIERFLIQVVGPVIDFRVERGPAELAALVTRPAGDESRLLIVVQQPESIAAETRDLLAEMAPHFGGGAVQVQVLFAGSREFKLPRMTTAVLPTFLPIAPVEDAAEQRSPRRRDILPLIILLLAVSLGAVMSLAPPDQNGIPQPAMEMIPPAMAADPAPRSSSLAPLSAPLPLATPAPDSVAGLRREFDLFLAQRASTLPPMSDQQRDTLFNEFLTRHRRE